MKIRPIWLLLLLIISVLYVPALAEDTFHSDFGWLPPEIPAGSGLVANELDTLFARIDQEGLPPSHRQRRIYEWIMQSINYDADTGSIAGAQDDPEAVFLCLSEVLKTQKSGDAGIALLAHYLLEKLGIPGVIISGELTMPDGNVQPHQWNYVFYNGKWYHFDPLAEMQQPELNGFMNTSKDLDGSALSWDKNTIPESAEYPVRALGCECDF